MKKKILIILILVLIIVSGFYYFKKDKNYNMMDDPSYRAELDKLNQRASVDYCVSGVYSNDYLGISLNCPNGLMAQEFYNGYYFTPKEKVNFILKKEKINVRDNINTIFSVGLGRIKFDPNNNYEGYADGEDFNQVDSFNFINKVEAATLLPLKGAKIENIKQITIGDNQYYTYSFMINKERTDVFISPRDNSYLDFRFNNQDKEFIENVLSSVKMIDRVTF
ncbi:MAG: hypothetical protein JJE53_02610 [Candidatus Pacebacteria bacterium]|nr:hypothetical protein [Candidatus Paceibacterota bacterium]